MEKEAGVFEIDLKDLFGLLWHNAWIIVLMALIFGGLSFTYSKKCIPVKYTSSVSVYVMNNQFIQNGGEILLSDINASQKLVETYSVILKDNVVMDEVGKKLIEKNGDEYMNRVFPVGYDENDNPYIEGKYISATVSMGGINETEVLKISANTTDPVVSADICTFITEIAPDVLTRVMGAAYVEPIGYAEVPRYKSSPNNTMNALIGACIGFVLAVGVIIIRRLLDNTVTDAEALQQRFNLPILGEIPYYEAQVKEEKANV